MYHCLQLLRFSSSALDKDEVTSLDEYVTRLSPSQVCIDLQLNFDFTTLFFKDCALKT